MPASLSPLRPKIGGLDPAAVARAEAALKSLSGQFDGWMQEEVAKLEQALAATQTAGLTGPEGEQLHTHAHDLKGLGGTYGFPIVTRIAGSLCRLTGSAATRARAPLAIVTAHVQAIRSVVTRGIRDEEDPAGLELLKALEGAVASALAAPR